MIPTTACRSLWTLAMMASCASVPSVSAASAEARRDWIVSGAELMQAMEGKLGDASRGDELRRQLSSTRANAYVSGVADTTSGVRWCGAGQILPHELVDRVYTYQRSLPAERLQQSAATLVVEALAQAFPCAAKR